MALKELCAEAVAAVLPDSAPVDQRQDFSLALFLPFCARLVAFVTGDVTHVKRGGMCVYEGWHDDLKSGLQQLEYRLESISQRALSSRHSLVWEDSREVKFKRRFNAMLTSPPYPNRSDYAEIFRPEQAVLDFLAQHAKGTPRKARRLIGTNVVLDEPRSLPNSRAARTFLEKSLRRHWKSVKQQRDEEIYYLPYYANYFCSIETMYENVATSAGSPFRGFIIVRDNSHHGLNVPVAAAISEVWESKGFRVSHARVDDTFHIGVKNPRAHGSRSVHTEYVIEVNR